MKKIFWGSCIILITLVTYRVSLNQKETSFIYGAGTLKSAHRGFTLTAPENTIASIQEAKTNGFDLVELDIQKTKDNELVLMHDETLERTTNGIGKLNEKTMVELEELIVSSEINLTLPKQKIPTFELACKKLSEEHLGVNIDGSKMDFSNQENLDRVIKILRKYELYSTSFFVLNEPARTFALKKYPDLAVTYTTGGEATLEKDIEILKKYENGFYSTAFIYITENLIQKLKENNIPLHVYAVKNQEEYEKCKQIGARFVETDVFIKE